MKKIFLNDIHLPHASAPVSFNDLIPVGDAVIGEDQIVRVTSKGGVRTGSFHASEEVAIHIAVLSEKKLSARVGCILADGSVNLDMVPPSTSHSMSGGIERIDKSFDAPGLSVYSGAVEFFIQIECEGPCELRLQRGNVRTKNELERLSVYAENLEAVLSKIDQRLADIEYNAASKAENIAVSPSGKRFYINVDNDGNIHASPLIPNKVLFVGNSLLLGMGTYGMCATSPKKDYFHFVSEAIKAKNSNAEISRVHGAKFEQLEDPSEFEEFWSTLPNAYTERPFCESITEDLDLIVIQLSENVSTEARHKTLAATIDRFLGAIKQRAPGARIVWVRSWWREGERDNIIEAACRRWNIGCISIADLYSKDTVGKEGQTYERSDGTVAVAPNYWLAHPGDAGMQAIAERIIDFLKL